MIRQRVRFQLEENDALVTHSHCRASENRPLFVVGRQQSLDLHGEIGKLVVLVQRVRSHWKKDTKLQTGVAVQTLVLITIITSLSLCRLCVFKLYKAGLRPNLNASPIKDLYSRSISPCQNSRGGDRVNECVLRVAVRIALRINSPTEPNVFITRQRQREGADTQPLIHRLNKFEKDFSISIL